MIGGQGEHAEHEMRHDLRRTADTYHAAAEFVFEPAEYPFHRGSLVVAHCFRGIEVLFFSPAPVRINDRNMPELVTVCFDTLSIRSYR